jgi:hypothetical protein
MRWIFKSHLATAPGIAQGELGGGVLGGIVGVLPSQVSAQVTQGIAVDVPFKFVVEATTFGPGKYIIKPLGDNDTVLQITGLGGHVTMDALTERTTRSDIAKTELVFEKHGDQQFLSKIFVTGNRDGAEILPSAFERKLDRHS